MSDYGVQRYHITEVVFYTKVSVYDILVRLEEIMDYAGVGLERFNCSSTFSGVCTRITCRDLQLGIS